jgi:monoamine oxidase
MVVFDATILLLVLRPNSGQPLDSTGQPVTQVQERIAHLVRSLERSRTRIAIPTPALSEVLVRAGSAGPQIVETLSRSTVFKIMPFDSLAAIEAAVMTRAAIDAGDKRGGSGATWAKIKFDRQIVAIAKVVRATAIYSDDADVRTIALAEDMPVIGLAELPVPTETQQMEMPLELPAQGEDANDQLVNEADSEPEAENDDGEATDEREQPS